MSSSMWAWRVVVPGLGLGLCLAILWPAIRKEAARTSRAEPESGPTPTTPAHDRVIAEGRVAPRPGAMVVLGVESGGRVDRVLVAEKARVKAGEVLVEFRSDLLQAELAEAEARLAEADAELGYAQREFARRSRSPAESATYKAELEANRRDYEIATARRSLAAAGVNRCRLAVGRCRLTSPIEGVVVACQVQAGEVVAPAARLITVCDLDRLRVEAEVDAFDVPRIKLGDDVRIEAEGYGSSSWAGVVEEIPDQVGDRTIAPGDPGRPTDIRVLLVKIRPSLPLPLKLGQQAKVEIRPKPR